MLLEKLNPEGQRSDAGAVPTGNLLFRASSRAVFTVQAEKRHV
jgi:hypothetical protein